MIKVGVAMDCVFVSPPDSHVEVLTPNVTIFEDRPFLEIIKAK